MKSLPGIPNLEGLTDMATRTGVDIRPTLLRVLTDLYVQKSAHTPEDERHYTELALRLIDEVDVQTKTSVALRLAQHSSSPPVVVQRLSDELPEIAALIAKHGAPPASAKPAAAARSTGNADGVTAAANDQAIAAHDRPAISRLDIGSQAHLAGVEPDLGTGPPAPVVAPLPLADRLHPDATERLASRNSDADELNELFFAAPATERRLILLNLEFVGPPEPRQPTARERIASYLLEAAALAHNNEEFVQQLGRSLRIGREQALRIIRDASGEPLVVAAKALRMPSDMLQRILLFLNPVIGHSVERVHGLARLYDAMTPQAADHLVAVWRKLRPSQRAETAHRPLYWDDEVRRARPGPAADARRSPPAADEAVAGRSGAR